jgi:vancomycin resistance protein YoaR
MRTASDTTQNNAATPPSRVRSWRIPLIGVTVGVLVLVGALAGLRLARSGALPGTVVAGIEVGGMAEPSLRRAVGSIAENRAARIVTAQHDDGAESARAGDLGYAMDADATVTAVLRRGRQLNPFTALADHLRAFGGTIEVEPVETIDEAVVVAWAAQAAERLAVDAVEGEITFDGATVNRVDPRPGAHVEPDPIEEQALAALEGTGPLAFEVETVPIEPDTTQAEVDAVAARAERAVSDDVVLTRNGAALRLRPVQIGNLLRAERGEDGTFTLVADPSALAALVDADLVAAFETDPVDARFEVSGGTVRIVESTDGFRFDAEIAAAQVVAVATAAGPREAELDGQIVAPTLSTADAQALNITEQVSTFTTEFPCCQSRVTNIHRIADIVNGVVIRPGETFSVNDFVGQRTTAKGFVDGGAIQAGEFVQEVGGGVSQFATTMFNAAFFGGYRIPAYKAHSYYISRYPVGREATLNFPDVDLQVENNSPHGLLIRTSYTGTSVTVSFYGTSWVEVDDITGERRNFRDPQVQYRENPALAPGAERTVQSGRQGFDITVTRILRFADGREEREEYFTRYLAEPRIVERNTATPEPQPTPDPGPTDPPPPPPDPQPDPQPEPPPAEPPANG